MQFNHFTHSAAGTGKTTKIVKLALKIKNKKVLITTYTLENLAVIQKKIQALHGFIPSNIEIISWFSFLLNECIRPYQNLYGIENRINEMTFSNSQSALYTPTNDIKHYINNDNSIYSDKLSEFAYNCNRANNNCIIQRLEKCYDYIFIDEAQDLSGYDFSLVDKFLESNIVVSLFGDARQTTFNTTPSTKNKRYSTNILKYFLDKETEKLGKLRYMNKSWRCNEQICKFSDKIFPDFPKTVSQNTTITGHDGLFLLKKEDFDEYYNKYKPQILIWDKRSQKKIGNKTGINIGVSKGSTYNRVLIVPTKPMLDFLETGKITSSPTKFYIAVTRSKYSVAFLIDDSKFTSIFPEITFWK